MNRETCPDCQDNSRTYRDGYNDSRSQRWYCPACRRDFTPVPNDIGHTAEMKRTALAMVAEGLGYRATARVLGITHQSVANWHHADQARVPSEVNDTTPTAVEEVDELFSFTVKKKSNATLWRG